MEELRKEFEKEIENLDPKDADKFEFDYTKWLEKKIQKLSKQVTEEELRNLRTEGLFCYTTTGFINYIFSHYTLIPKED